MAESAGRYCPLCGAEVGLMDRFCRRCGERLGASPPGKARVPSEDANMPPLRRERRWLGYRSSVEFGAAGIVIAIIVLSVGCAIIGVAVGVSSF